MKISKSGSPTKPKNVGKVNRELVESTKKDPSLESLAGLLEKGHSVVLGDFDGARKNENFISTKYLGLDFDTDSITIEGNMNKSDELELTPALVYKTFTATDKIEKHRIFFKLDRAVDAREFKLLQLGLMKLFPECDKACKESVRIFYGTNKPVQVIGGTVEVSHLLYLIKKFFYELDSVNKSREIKDFSQLTGVEVINGQLALGMDIEDIKWTVTVEESKGLTKQTRTGTTYKKAKAVNKKVKRELKQIDIEDLATHFPLLKDFFEGKYWASYPELLMIASNLAFIKGGMKRFNQVIDDNPQFYNNNRHNQDYYKIQAYNFINYYEEPKPMNFTGAFEQYLAHGKNFLTAYNNKQKKYTRLIEDSKEEINMQQAEKELSVLIDKALESKAKAVVVKVPTGLGKSHAMIHQINYESLRMKSVLAFPNHKLREEIYERFLEAGEFPATTIEKPVHLLPIEDREMYNSLMTAGDIEGAGKYFTKAMKKHKLTDNEEYQDYLYSLRSTKKALVSLTTHELALSSHLYEMGAEMLIIDEDCLPTLFHQKDVKLHDIELLLEAVSVYPNSGYLQAWLKKLIAEIKQDKTMQATALISRTGDSFVGKVHELEPISFPVSNILNKISKLLSAGTLKFSSSVMDLFRADSFWNLNTNYNKGALAVSDGIKLVTKPKLPANVEKIIILSATASKAVWQKVDKDIEFFELSAPVKNQGTVVQFLENTSKSKLIPDLQNAVVYEMTQRGVNLFITYKSDKFFGESSGVIKGATFGALDGLDHLKGRDLAVVGTPNLTESDYNLQAFALSGSLPTRMANRLVEYNGFRFPLFTFEKGFYQDYHLYCIDGALTQAIGRARVKRTDATVYVISHVPVEADEHYYEGQLV